MAVRRAVLCMPRSFSNSITCKNFWPLWRVLPGALLLVLAYLTMHFLVASRTKRYAVLNTPSSAVSNRSDMMALSLVGWSRYTALVLNWHSISSAICASTISRGIDFTLVAWSEVFFAPGLTCRRRRQRQRLLRGWNRRSDNIRHRQWSYCFRRLGGYSAFWRPFPDHLTRNYTR